MMRQKIIQGYTDAAAELALQYEAISSSDLYSPILHLLPEAAGSMIDIGAGTGRDAAWFAAKGYKVLAVEPVAGFRAAGASLHRDPRIEWLDDELPTLARVLKREETFDLVMLNAVWQHLDTDQRQLAMRNARILTAPAGFLMLSVRHGPGAPTRPCFETNTQDTIESGNANGFQLKFIEERESIQASNRTAGVSWTWLVFSPTN